MHKGDRARFFRGGGRDAFYLVNTSDEKMLIQLTKY